MTWLIVAVAVGALWAVTALIIVERWSRVKIAEMAVVLTRLQLEHGRVGEDRIEDEKPEEER